MDHKFQIRSPIVAALLAVAALSGCKDKDVEANAEEPDFAFALSDAGDGDVQVVQEQPPTDVERLKWEGDFAPWWDQEISNEDRLPECPTGWFDSPVDDEFVAWKCSNFKGMELGDVGQFTVHTRNERVFMVTNAFDFNSEKDLAQAVATLRKINSSRRITLSEKYRSIGSELWNLTSYVTLLSTGTKGLSLVYLRDRKDVEVLYGIVKRQTSLSRLKKSYRLGLMDFKVMTHRKEDFVGRGRERWDAKQSADFVIVEYEVRNMDRSLAQVDSARFTIIGKDKKYRPNERAEHAFFTSDKTGQYKGSLEYRKWQNRAHVFEIDKEATARPMVLVISDGDDKAIYRIDLRG